MSSTTQVRDSRSIAMHPRQLENSNIRSQERALLQIRRAVAELSDKFNKVEPLSDESFDRIEEIFQDLDKIKADFNGSDEHLKRRWFQNKQAQRAGICVLGAGIFLAWINPVLNGILYYLQGAQTCYISSSPNTNSTDITSANAVNATVIAEPSETNSELQLGVIIASTVAAILMSINSMFGECNRRAIDDYEREKSENSLRTNLNNDLRTFFQDWKSFNKKQNRDNLRMCAYKLNLVAQNELLEPLGSKERVISGFIKRVDDPVLRGELERLQAEIQADIISQTSSQGNSRRRDKEYLDSSHEGAVHHRSSRRREREPLDSSNEEAMRHSRTRRKARGERGLDEEPARRASATLLSEPTRQSIQKFIKELKLDINIDCLQIGEWWISNDGTVSRTEQQRESTLTVETISETAPLQVDLNEN